MQTPTTRMNEVDYETKPAPALPWDQGAPVINGPDVYGASPGKDMLYLIPTLGERPLRFSASGLPEGLSLDPDNGIITGGTLATGTHTVSLTVENRHGKTTRSLKLVIAEDALALTPPMGWNSWNCYRSNIDDVKIREIAEGMISSGLAARGYAYVNMDSGWQSASRGGPFNSIVPKAEFPDMKVLCDHIHSLGLKAGIYSGPYVVPWGTQGCGSTSGLCDTNFHWHNRKDKYIGINKHEHEDVSQWAAWGFDYFKYDWSRTDMLLTERMSRELRNSSRDIVFSITTGVNIADAERVKELTNLWRSNGDTSPTWESVVKNGFRNEQWNSVIGPGHWFDLDMTALLPRDGKCLTPNEMIACISCWMMRPSPILIDCDPTKLDDAMLSLLCNEEIIAVNQDVLGKPAISIFRNDTWDIQLKPLADNSYALAFFNLGDVPAIAPAVNLTYFGMPERCQVRDLWRRQDLGQFGSDAIVGVAPHCAKVYKVFIV